MDELQATEAKEQPKESTEEAKAADAAPPESKSSTEEAAAVAAPAKCADSTEDGKAADVAPPECKSSAQATESADVAQPASDKGTEESKPADVAAGEPQKSAEEAKATDEKDSGELVVSETSPSRATALPNPFAEKPEAGETAADGAKAEQPGPIAELEPRAKPSTNPFAKETEDVDNAADAAKVEQPELTGTAAAIEAAESAPAPAGGVMSILAEPDEVGSSAASTATPLRPAAEPEVAAAGAAVDAELTDAEPKAVAAGTEPMAEAEAAEDFTGEYQWRSKDGTREGVLRLRPGGQWWHAAHQSPIINIDNAEQRSPEFDAAAKLGKIWEMAECLGSWQMDSGKEAISMTCEHCRWASDKPDEDHVFRPSKEKMMELDDLVASGVMVFHYVPGQCPSTGRKRLEFQLQPNYRLPAEARMLGLARGYYKVNSDEKDGSLLPSSEELLTPEDESSCAIS